MIAALPILFVGLVAAEAPPRSAAVLAIANHTGDRWEVRLDNGYAATEALLGEWLERFEEPDDVGYNRCVALPVAGLPSGVSPGARVAMVSASAREVATVATPLEFCRGGLGEAYFAVPLAAKAPKERPGALAVVALGGRLDASGVWRKPVQGAAAARRFGPAVVAVKKALSAKSLDCADKLAKALKTRALSVIDGAFGLRDDDAPGASPYTRLVVVSFVATPGRDSDDEDGGSPDSVFTAVALATTSGDRVAFVDDPGCELGRSEEILRGAVDIDGDGFDEGLMTRVPHEGDQDDYLVTGR